SHVYTFDGGPDDAFFQIVDNQLQTAARFDYEGRSSYTVRIRSTDLGGLSVAADFTITITNVNEAPTAITLTTDTVAENLPAGTLVGPFHTADPDTKDTATYTLVSGAGDADNASFSIDVQGNLQTSARFDFEARSSYSIRVRSTDSGGLSTEQVFA